MGKHGVSGRDGFDQSLLRGRKVLPELRTPRLILREIRPEDGPELQAYQSMPANWRLQAVSPEEYSDGKRIERYMQYRGEGEERRLHVFVARSISTDQLIGEIGVSRTYPETVAIGFSVVPQQWGHGFGTEMANRALTFCFDNLRAHRVTAAVAIENTACCRVLERIGMTLEGTSCECIKAQGRWWSEHQYAIIASDNRTI